MAIVFVVDLQIGVGRLAFPVADQLEGTRSGTLFGAHLVLENVDVEIGRGGILLGLAAQQRGEGRHVEFEHTAEGG